MTMLLDTNGLTEVNFSHTIFAWRQFAGFVRHDHSLHVATPKFTVGIYSAKYLSMK